MRRDQRSVRLLLVLVLVPVLIIAGVLATAVLGHGGSRHRAQPAERAPQSPSSPGGAVRDVERLDVGSGARGAAVLRPPGSAGEPGPVVIFLHGWAAIDPGRYGAWIEHLVRGGATVIFPTYQTRPARDTITPLVNVLTGVRAALAHVSVAPGRLVVAGHSVGGALAADYAAVAGSQQLPVPAAVFSVYPGRRLRHLTTHIPEVDPAAIAPGTRVLALAGERDSAVGVSAARRIADGAVRADAELRLVRDDAVDDHSAPRRVDAAAQRTFWEPLDELIGATAPDAPIAPLVPGGELAR